MDRWEPEVYWFRAVPQYWYILVEPEEFGRAVALPRRSYTGEHYQRKEPFFVKCFNRAQCEKHRVPPAMPEYETLIREAQAWAVILQLEKVYG